ncbi:hypothetical protein LP52_18750 [Streptomonospora alba]|uniref:Lipoprotein n=1 Tax=Streptomonospora alba TaxID=183763 RepID=A0A0C2J7P2_9ACTN|nr:hypothetical protein [Streptomonospora alba]KIH97476.1 hypothetical protein LP52_18750 [Streptomonospora alba]
MSAALVIILAAGCFAAVKVLTPADRTHRFANGVSVQLISFDRGRHDGTPYAAWSLNILNGSGSSIRLAPRTRCWTGLPPRRADTVPAVDKAGRVAVNVPPGTATTLRGACAMAAEEDRFLYSVRLSEDYDSGLGAPFAFHGKMPV